MRQWMRCISIIFLFSSTLVFAESNSKHVKYAYNPVPHVYHAGHQNYKPMIYRPKNVSKKTKTVTYHPIPHVYKPVAVHQSKVYVKPVTPSHHWMADVKQKVEHYRSRATQYKQALLRQHPALYAVGPYVGASVGARTNASGSPAIYGGVEGILSAGYGHMWNRFYLAGEFFGGESAQVRNAINNQSDMQSGWSIGGDLIPGYLINDRVIGYLRLGGVSTQFNGADTNQGAWRLGGGAQTTLYKNLDLRGEYIFSQYQTIQSMGTPYSNQFNLGIVYKFV